MIRILKTIHLVIAVLGLSVLAAPTTQAETSSPAEFTIGSGPTFHAEQVGSNAIGLKGLPNFTCAAINASGGPATPEPSFEEIEFKPTYETCHIILLFVTRTVTFTFNGCVFVLNADATVTGDETEDFTADTDIACPPEKSIEIHTYNTSNHNDAGMSTLCTYDISAQTNLSGIDLTNDSEAVPDDIVSHLNIEGVVIKNTILSGTCGNNTNTTATITGTQTIRATNESGEFVNTSVSG